MLRRMIVLMSVVGLALAGFSVAFADIPLMINHQGLVKVDGGPFTGPGYFKFGFLDSTTSTWLWTNDGSHIGDPVSTVPDTPVTVPVNYGVYNVRLGDTALTGMTAIPSSVFDNNDVKLRVIFDDGVTGEEILSPDQQITSAAYAYHAARADLADKAHIAHPSLFGVFGGDGSDGDITVSSNTDFSALTGGADNYYLQADDFTVESGVTLTVDTGWAHIGVKGTCTIHGTIDAIGQGEEGGQAGGTYGGAGRRADGRGDVGFEPSTSARGIDYTSHTDLGFGQDTSLLQQHPVPFCISGAGGGGGNAGTAAGAGGGAGSYGGRGGPPVGGDALSLPPDHIRVLTGGSSGDNTTHGHSPVILMLIRYRGAGGGGGHSAHGGKGGGVIYIECDTFDFDGTLTADGADGNTSGPYGGGGGGGGVIVVRAKTIITSTGVVSVAGGSGGGTDAGDGAAGFKDVIQVK